MWLLLLITSCRGISKTLVLCNSKKAHEYLALLNTSQPLILMIAFSNNMEGPRLLPLFLQIFVNKISFSESKYLTNTCSKFCRCARYVFVKAQFSKAWRIWPPKMVDDCVFSHCEKFQQEKWKPEQCGLFQLHFSMSWGLGTKKIC